MPGIERVHPTDLLRRVAVAAVALPWAVVLVVAGLWLILASAQAWGGLWGGSWGVARGCSIIAGCTAIAAGHLVFAVCVGARLFPEVPLFLGRGMAVVLSIAVIAGVAVLMAFAVAGARAGFGAGRDVAPSGSDAVQVLVWGVVSEGDRG